MSFFNTSVEEIHSLQEKLQDVVDCTNVSDVLTISEEIDSIIKVNV